MSGQLVQDQNLGALKVAASWPGADRTTLVTLATVLAATGADEEGLRYFDKLTADQPDRVLALTLAGYFGVRVGDDIAANVARLDDAAGRDLGPAQFYRGLALAGLPAGAGHAEQAIADLEFVLAVRDQFPSNMIRGAYHGLAAAYRALGRDDLAGKALADSGLAGVPADVQLQFSGGWLTEADGYHFSPPRIAEVAPGIRVAHGYDFGDFAFVTTAAGVVAIDAGTAPHRVAAAMADAGIAADDVTHVILTHSHFDHAGGIAAFLRPETRVIAAAGFPAELAHQQATLVPFSAFTGEGAGFGSREAAGRTPAEIATDRLVAGRTELSIDGTDFVLYPTTGGETDDALMVYLPGSGVLFTGDVAMPYLGAPFFAEGSPDGLLEALALIAALEPAVLVHGHTVLTELIITESVPGLLAGLTELRDKARAGLRKGLTLTELLAASALPPEILRDHPAAVGAYLAIREHFVQRLHRQESGYWQPDGEGMAPVSPDARAAALNLLAAGDPGQFAKAAQALVIQGDAALALEIANAGLRCYQDHAELTELRQQALYRLMERHQLQDPFRFLIYAQMAGVQLAAIAAG
jgi:glyoxylase-like metal-dependent hydrolase (beta-lactamase superfamily II)